MLRTIGVESAAKDLGFDGEDSIIDGVDDGSKIDKAEFWIDSQVKLSISNNKIKPSLAKSQLLIEPSSGSSFLTSKARLAFAELRQTSIEALILYHFDIKYYIWVETNTLGYVIDGILSQLTLNDSISKTKRILSSLPKFSLSLKPFCQGNNLVGSRIIILLKVSIVQSK